jgi:hypothetical protein
METENIRLDPAVVHLKLLHEIIGTEGTIEIDEP